MAEPETEPEQCDVAEKFLVLLNMKRKERGK